MLSFNNVKFSYDDNKVIIDNLNFTINKGDFVGFIGKSGCGKSTIFRLILGFEKPQLGEIKIDENLKIGFMPQKDLLFPWRTIEENLSLPLEVKKINKKEIQEKVNKILYEMDLLETKNKYPFELSGGMRQRIAFARTVLTGADILLLDEPFSALDYFTRMDFQDWIIEQYIKLKKTILFITHSVDEAILLSNRIFLFENKNSSKGFEEILINDSYPRSQEILFKKEMIDLKSNLIKKLRTNVA